ncbi:DUF3035 domain-containing protein [Amaricoccus sp.]|uniref:DUF3035 domain-containing protein n=1 Tax=Amaricoccus sp. TaxID=1872485 RepID=UPI001B4729A7|nr:DUF3035 domain-containing protein [Amaricoccus sp.]MBP7243218.1 DUF3035 domain-containing protein [Amaricoccus sp.]
MRSADPLRLTALLLAAAALAGCAEGGIAGNLRAAGIGGTPDEFMVLPTKPLEMPADLAALPAPTPGAVNRVDYQPKLQAVASLTGKETPAGTASAGPLIARAGPVDPNIRAELAAADVVYRENNRGQLIPRLILQDNELLIYDGEMLDRGAEFERLRAQGVAVPPAPPTVVAE